MFLTFTFLVTMALPLGGHTRTQDSQDIIVALCVSNYDDPSPDWPDGDEPLLLVGMFLVVDLQVVNASLEKLGGFLETQVVLCPVDIVLRWIPLESHCTERIYANDLVSQWLMKG